MKLLAAWGLIGVVLPAASCATPAPWPALQPASVQPERWVRVGGGSANPYVEYLDKESVRRSGDKVHAWTRRVSAQARNTRWHELELNCLTRTETILAYIRDDRGTISHNDARPHREASPIRNGSVEDRIFNMVCR